MNEKSIENKTRETLINTGALLIHRQGYNNTGLKEILEAAGVPKGSFYFYFKSKEDFGLQLIDHYRDMLEGIFRHNADNKSLDPLERLDSFLNRIETIAEKTAFTLGCPIGNMVQELSAINENFRQKLLEAYNGMIGMIAGLLEEAREGGRVSSDTDCRELARFLFNSYQGALLHMKAEKSTAPLEVMRKFFRRYIELNQKQ